MSRAAAILVLLAGLAGCAIMSPEGEEALYDAAARMRRKSEDWYAYEFYEKFYEKYPASMHAQEALQNMFEIALSQAGSEWGVARLRELVEEFPAAPLTPEAQFKIGRHYFDNHSYDEAILELKKLYADYPESERVEAAMFLIAQSFLAQYHGTEYDGSPLRNARVQFERLLSMSPEGGYARDANERIAHINTELAHRDFLTALYYRDRGRPASAATYLNSIVKEYPDTEYAEKAKKMLPAKPKLEK